MTLQHCPLTPRSNEIKDSDVPKYVRELKDFLGHEALAKAQADLDKDLQHHGGCYQRWAQHLKPWLFAFRTYDLITKNDTHTPSAWPTAIRELVGDALMITSLHHRMPEEVRSKYRKDLLLSQHNDFMVEIFAAWHYYLEGYDVQWYPLGHIKCPEFRVQGGGLDFDVECRRFCRDLSEDIKTPAIADTCDTIYKGLELHNLWGQVGVEFADDFNFDPGCIPQWSKVLARALDSGQTTLQLDPTVRLTLELKPSPSPAYTPKELVDMARDKHPTERSYLQSKRNGDAGFDPIVFRCSGPRKTPEELRDYIYKTLKEKVNTQLAPDRAGVVIVRFTGLRDPNVFNESEGIKEALTKLFEQPHLTAVILQCEGVAKSETGSILYSTPSIVYRNKKTTFPQVAAAMHLS
jgi:hypothetical protein